MQRDDWLAVLVILVGVQLALMMLGFELVLRSVEAQGRPLVRRQRDSPEDRPL